MNGNRLKKTIKQRGMTQFDLAEAADLSEATISHYVNEKRGIYYYNIVAICKALNVSADYLLGLSDDIGEQHD